MASRKARRRGGPSPVRPAVPAGRPLVAGSVPAPSSGRRPGPPRERAPSAPPSRGPRSDALRRAAPWVALSVLLAGAALAYGPALHGEFHFDDWGSIQANMALRGPDALRLPSLVEILRPARAVTQLSFALDYRAAGLEPLRYHVVSLLLHLAAGVLAFLFTRELLRRAGHPRAAALAVVTAGAFELHPIQSQAVAYAAQRAEVLASLFYLVCLLLLDAAAARGRTLRAGASWAAAIASWLVAMGSKSIAITAPAVFVLEQAVVASGDERGSGPLARRSLRALVLAAPLLLLAAWSAALHLGAFASNPGAGVGAESAALPTGRYVLSQLRVQWLYLRLLAWPDALTLDRGFTASPGLDAASALAGAGIVVALLLAAWLWLRAERAPGAAPAERLAAFGIFFWFVVLAPTSSVVPVVDLAVEHRVYLASLGPILALVVGVDAALHRTLAAPRAALAGAALAAAALLALAVALTGRARVWATEESLWSDAAAKYPDSPRILTNLGLALQRKGDIKGAEAAYRRGWVLARVPLDVVQLSRNLGGLLSIVGRHAESLVVLDRGLEVAPDHPDLRMNRAVALAQLDRSEEALAEARRALGVAPGDPTLLNVYGEILAYQRNWAEALAAFQAATALDPGSPIYYTYQALALIGLGRKAEACEVLRQAAARYGAERLPADAARWKAAIGCPP